MIEWVNFAILVKWNIGLSSFRINSEQSTSGKFLLTITHTAPEQKDTVPYVFVRRDADPDLLGFDTAFICLKTFLLWILPVRFLLLFSNNLATKF